MTCRELMTPDPACCTPGDTVVTAAMIMKSHDVGSVPVVSDRGSMTVTGMITDRDIAMRVVAEQRDYYNTRVEDVMSRDVVTCRTADDYDDVIKAMKKHQIRRIPVVDSEKRLVGIIAQADVARSASASEDVGEMVGEISEPSEEYVHDGQGLGYTKAGLLIAGGLGLGAGLIYLLDPRWARPARDAVNRAAQRVSDTVTNAADRVTDAVSRGADTLRDTMSESVPYGDGRTPGSSSTPGSPSM